MSDSLVNGRKFRLLNIMYDFNRKSLAVEVDTLLSSLRVIRVLERLIADKGKPVQSEQIMVLSLSAISCSSGVRITPLGCSNSTGQAYAECLLERKNGSIRRELLGACLFDSLTEVRVMSEECRTAYNCERPHSALDYLSPIRFMETYKEKSKQLYAQTANGNPLQIEESRLVSKAVKT